MSKWRVYNKHSLGMTHKEKFRDELIEIKPGSYVVMDYEDAVQFKGQFFPMKKKPTGEDDPAGWKMIQLMPHDESKEIEIKKYVCHLDGKEFNSQAELNAYVAMNYADRSFADDALDQEIEVTAKRKPGRPAKEKTA